MTSSGSSVITARPMVSDFSAMPGPEVVVTPSEPPNDAPSAAPMPAISSSAWNVVTPNALVLAQLVEDVGGRRDRVGAEEQRQPRLHAAGDQAVGQRQVAGDVAVGARRHRRRLDLVGDHERLGGLAEVPARAERRDVGVADVGRLGERF